MTQVPTALTIAGSDPSGGAGIQADLKTFSALGVYGMSVVTALTAQNTNGVQASFAIPPAFITAQLESIFEVMHVGAVKIGMLANTEIIQVVADALTKHQPRHVVLDPVMISKSGHALLAPEAIEILRTKLLPLASLITPNLPEAAVLLDTVKPTCEAEMQEAAYALQSLGARNVLIKGGHLSSQNVPDLLAVSKLHTFTAARITTQHTHGTGCTLSSAIAAYLARGHSLPEAVRKAKEYVYAAIQNNKELQHIHTGAVGPIHHFHELWSTEHVTVDAT